VTSAGHSVRPPGLPIILFDGDCGFCTRSADWLTGTFPGSIEVVPYQHAYLNGLGVTEADCASAVQWVPRDGQRQHGAAAIAAALRAGGAGRPDWVGWSARATGAITAVPPLAWLAALAYRWVSANRHRLPGGTPACQLRTTSRDERQG
jgi:predicted DCC family thiol-disulfide oxidoreductase YuxK